MEILVENVGCIKEAKINTDAIITLIASPNYKGKSWLCRAIGATLIGEPKIFKGLTKKDLKEIVRDDSKQAIAQVIMGDINDSEMTITWPDGEYTTKGPPIKCSDIAVGLKHITNMDYNERLSFFTDVVGILPTKDDLSKALKVHIGDTGVNKIWDDIETIGWDGYKEKVRDLGATLKDGKTGFLSITGMNYGSKQCKTWEPIYWEADLLNADIEQLKKTVKDAQECFNAALKHNAVSEHEMDVLKIEAEDFDKLEKLSRMECDKLTRLRKEIDDSKALIKSNDLLLSQPMCPHCGKLLKIKGGEVLEGTKITATKIKKLEDETFQARHNLKKLEADCKEADISADILMRNLNKSRDAKEKLLKTETITEDDKEKGKRVEADLVKAKNRLNAFTDKNEADSIVVKLELNKIILDVLAKDGLRKDVLFKRIGEISNDISSISQSANWGKIEFDEKLNLLYENEYGKMKTYLFCSESQQYRVNVALQVYVAKLLNDPLVLIDRADILDKKGRNGLMSLIISNEIKAIVFMTLNPGADGKPVVPNLSKIGGKSFWINEGVVKEVV